MNFTDDQIKQIVLKTANENGLTELSNIIADKVFRNILNNPFHRDIIKRKISFFIEEELVNRVRVDIERNLEEKLTPKLIEKIIRCINK